MKRNVTSKSVLSCQFSVPRKRDVILSSGEAGARDRTKAASIAYANRITESACIVPATSTILRRRQPS